MEGRSGSTFTRNEVNKMRNKTRYIPDQYVEYKPEIGDYPKDLFATYVWFNGDTYRAMFFSGKRSQPNWHYNFGNDRDRMKKEINESISRLMSWEDMKAKRKEERKNVIKDIKVGDLFSSSWGYDQTNVDFYQVIAVKGKTFTIRPIGGRTVPGSGGDYSGMADKVTAVRDAFLEDLVRYPILTKRSLKLNSYSWLSKTTEQEQHYRSWYA